MNRKNLFVLIVIIFIMIFIAAVSFILKGRIHLPNNNPDMTDTDYVETGYNPDDYITLEDVTFNDKVSTKKVKLNNLSDEVTSKFYEDEQAVIDGIHPYDGEEFNAEYDLKYFINGDILSIVYTIKETNAMGTCATMAAVTNIDLNKEKVVTQEELLTMAGSSYRKFVESAYDKELASWTKLNEMMEHDIDYYEVTFEDYKANKEKYVNIGLEKIPNVIYIYIEDGEIKYDYYEIKMDTLFHQVGKGGCFNWKTNTLGYYE